jgi:hypothetical protein
LTPVAPKTTVTISRESIPETAARVQEDEVAKMTVVLDHTIVPARDREEAVEFYTRILGFQDLGEVGPFLAVRVNDTLNFDFSQSDDFRSIHYAFAMTPEEFEPAFKNIRDSGIPYGVAPSI